MGSRGRRMAGFRAWEAPWGPPSSRPRHKDVSMMPPKWRGQPGQRLGMVQATSESPQSQGPQETIGGGAPSPAPSLSVRLGVVQAFGPGEGTTQPDGLGREIWAKKPRDLLWLALSGQGPRGFWSILKLSPTLAWLFTHRARASGPTYHMSPFWIVRSLGAPACP